MELAMAGSRDCMLARLADGVMLWTAEREHSQTVVGGRFRDDVEGLQLFFTERNGGAYVFDARGNELWRGELHGIATPIQTALNDMPEQLLVLHASGEFPTVMDGYGGTIATLEGAPGKDARVAPWREKWKYSSGDFGGIYHPLWVDVDGDGEKEFVTYDRERLWIHKL
jgi:hypothetical protein